MNGTYLLALLQFRHDEEVQEEIRQAQSRAIRAKILDVEKRIELKLARLAEIAQTTDTDKEHE